MTNVEAMAMVKSAPAGASAILARLAAEGEVDLNSLDNLARRSLLQLMKRKRPVVEYMTRVIQTDTFRDIATPDGMRTQHMGVKIERKTFYRLIKVAK